MSQPNSLNQPTTPTKTPKFNFKVLTWTIFSYLGAVIFLGLAIWSIYYFSLPHYAQDFIHSLQAAGRQSFAQFVNIWQYTFFPWCILCLVCLIFAGTGTVKLKDNRVGKPTKNPSKKKLGY